MKRVARGVLVAALAVGAWLLAADHCLAQVRTADQPTILPKRGNGPAKAKNGEQPKRGNGPAKAKNGEQPKQTQPTARPNEGRVFPSLSGRGPVVGGPGSINSPYPNPFGNPFQNQYSNPFQNPYSNPYQNPYSNPYTTPYPNPFAPPQPNQQFWPLYPPLAPSFPSPWQPQVAPWQNFNYPNYPTNYYRQPYYSPLLANPYQMPGPWGPFGGPGGFLGVPQAGNNLVNFMQWGVGGLGDGFGTSWTIPARYPGRFGRGF
ncbi:MAG: hypothetical protein IT429_01315 [Gemmataceae bacterium]|nr:hypothetical protein [Gemmataceae bacterium]